MDSNALFGIINEFYCTISANFYLYLQYFYQISFQFQQNKQIPTGPLVIGTEEALTLGPNDPS